MFMDKISISALDKIVKETYPPVAELDWHGEKLVILRTLPLQSMLRFVDSVVKSCFNSETRDYMPEAKDFAILNKIVESYTNVNTPSNYEHLYKLLYQTDLIPTVMKEVNTRQFNEMMQAIDEKIRYRAESNSERIVSKMNTIAARVNELVEQAEMLFDGISKDDIAKLASALANANIDEEKIVHLLMEQRDAPDSEVTDGDVPQAEVTEDAPQEGGEQ